MGGLLDKPETTKFTQHGEGNGLSYAVSSVQGWRLEMEDSDCSIISLDGELKDWSFFAVFDGHNGSAVSKYCSEKLLELIINTDEFKESIASKEFNEKQVELVEIAIKKAFLKLDETMKEHFEKNDKKDKSGTTVSCCLISPTHIFFSNCGDSRSIMCKSNNVIFSTNDHKPTKQVERERIKNAGGNVMLERVNGCLAVSRALGDYEYKQRDDKGPCEQLVSPEPEINVIKRDNLEDEFIILACDGVWDVMNNEDLSSFVRHQLQICNTLHSVTESVIDVCLNKASLDNMTVIIVKLPGAPKFDQEKSQLDNELNNIIIEKTKDLIKKSANFEKVFSEIKYDELKNMPPGVGIESKCSIIENIYFQKTGQLEKYCQHVGIKRS